MADNSLDTAAFVLLARGMKDKEAVYIVHALRQIPDAFTLFERWAGETLAEQSAGLDLSPNVVARIQAKADGVLSKEQGWTVIDGYTGF